MKEQKTMSNQGRVTLTLLMGIFFSIFAAIAFDFGSMAITGQRDGHDLLASALGDLMGTEIRRGTRGEIRDRNGSIIATQETSFRIFANKNPAHGSRGHVADIEETARRLSPVLGLSEADIRERLTSGSHHIEFGVAGSQLTVRQRNEILEMGLAGIDFIPNMTRSYPNGVFASHTVGFAVNEARYRVTANKEAETGWSVVEDLSETARALSTVLNMSEERILELLNREPNAMGFTVLEQGLTEQGREAIMELGLPGIYANESHRVLTGRMGIEEYFDAYLQGTEGQVAFLRDSRGRVQPHRELITTQQYHDGFDIYLTIDSGIQLFLEQALQEAWETYEPESLVAIVADPRTGELLAMGNRSSFDPNTRENIEFHFNPLVFEAVEPGSTMKVFTYAAAIEEGRYVGHETFQTGSMTTSGGGLISDWRPGGWGRLTFNEGFYVSANTAIIQMLTDWITPERNLQFFDAFGFGRTTGIELFNEQPGMIPFDATLLQQYNAAFGQGLTTTPIQHIQAMTAILNEGQMLRPQIVSRIVDPNTGEVVRQPGIEVVGQPISASTARQVMDLMVGVVEDDLGTGRLTYHLGEISSGGKTGTAQIPDPVYGGYLEGEFLYSYVGFAPADNPRLVMYLAMSSPTYGDGHVVLSEIYRFVMNQSLAYLGMERQERVALEDVHELVEISSVLNLSVDRAVEMIEALGLEAVVIGERDQVFAQLPEAGTLTVAGSKVFLQTERTAPLPDFTGWTRAEVNQYRLLTGLNLVVEGHGFVVAQSMDAGSLATAGQTLILTLSRGIGDEPPLESEMDDGEQALMEGGDLDEGPPLAEGGYQLPYLPVAEEEGSVSEFSDE